MNKEKMVVVETLFEELVSEIKAGRGDEEKADAIRDRLDEVWEHPHTPKDVSAINKYVGDLMRNIKSKRPSEKE